MYLVEFDGWWKIRNYNEYSLDYGITVSGSANIYDDYSLIGMSFYTSIKLMDDIKEALKGLESKTIKSFTIPITISRTESRTYYETVEKAPDPGRV